MCGIVGYVGNRPVVDILIQGLKRLEYRGYDSAGVAFFKDSQIQIKKSEGKLEHVENLLNGSAKLFEHATCGIGHTRWATHGKPTTQNAHPHRTGHVVLVHNGIIENYQEIKKELATRGHNPVSETDSELFGFLVFEKMEKGMSLQEAVRQSFLRVRGASTVVVMSEREPDVIVGVKNGTPLVAAVDPEKGAMLASDAQPLLQISQEVMFLEHGDLVVGTRRGIQVFSLDTGKPLERAMTRLDWSVDRLDKEGYAHYMLKEIHEQPTALLDTLNGLMDRTNASAFPMADQPAVQLLTKAKEITIVACGTSWHAALVGKYWFERWAKVRVNVELASEFRYRDPVLDPKGVLIGITQSGETADTLAVIQQVRKLGIPTIGITNVRGSTISREADAVLYSFAGPEIGVAATKTFLAQLATLIVVAGYLGSRNSDTKEIAARLFQELVKLPHVLTTYLESGGLLEKQSKKAAQALSACKGFFFIGRGFSFPIALEGALKLKEIAYVHAEGYAGGELKHGPIAMIDKDMCVVVLAPKDRWRDKTISNLEEVRARGARILGIGDETDLEFISLCDQWIGLPSGASELTEGIFPFLMTPPIQLFSYELACLKGTDVDKPRNLAKSVTVE